MNPHVTYLIERFKHDTGISFEKHGVLLCRAGSRAHNTFTEQSDHDYFGIVAPGAKHVLGLTPFDSWEPKAGTLDHELDCKIYSIQKAVTLLLKGNPNMLEVLWYPDHVYEICSATGQSLIGHRDCFSSQQAYQSLAKYAYAQFKRMMSGTDDIRPKYEKAVAIIEAAGWTVEQVVTEKHCDMPNPEAVLALLGDEAPKDDNRLVIAFRAASKAAKDVKEIHARHFQAYMGEKRKQNVLTFGYDPKNASHLLRLLFMGIDFAKTTQLTPWMEGGMRDAILSVKRGEWPLDKLKRFAEHLWALSDQAFHVTALPEEPARDFAERLLIEIQRAAVHTS